MSQHKKSSSRARSYGILLGVVLAIVCQAVPDDYKIACDAIAKVTAMSCGG